LATLPSDVVDEFRRDLRAANEAVAAGVVPSRSAAAQGHWNVWADFCRTLRLDPTLAQEEDPVTILQVYMQRYRSGKIAPRHRQVRSRTVEDSLRAIGQAFAAVGADDPRLDTKGKIDFRIRRQLAGYKRKDPPPDRVKPVPVQIIRHLFGVAYSTPNDGNQAIADMIALAFFFLLRPGEYTGSPSDTRPFYLEDVQFWIGSQRHLATTIRVEDLNRVTFATLTFTSQKNGVRGEVIGLGRSRDPLLCPVLALARRVRHLRQHNAPATTPLATYYDNHNRPRPVKPADITESLRASTAILGPSVGFLPKDISARSLRAAGAMALLCAQVDKDVIRLLGRWRSDEMLRYLHVQAEPVMRHFAQRMLSGGAFTLLPNQDVPII